MNSRWFTKRIRVEPYKISFSVFSFIFFTAAIIVIPVTSVIQSIVCLIIYSPPITIIIVVNIVIIIVFGVTSLQLSLRISMCSNLCLNPLFKGLIIYPISFIKYIFFWFEDNILILTLTPYIYIYIYIYTSYKYMSNGNSTEEYNSQSLNPSECTLTLRCYY